MITVKFKSVLLLIASASLIITFNNCAEKKLDIENVSNSSNSQQSIYGGISAVGIQDDLVTLKGTELDSITSVNLKGGDKVVNLSIQTKTSSQLVARASSILELASGLYNIVVKRAEAETVAPIQVNVSSNAKFTSLPMTRLGSVPNVGGTTKEFAIPSSVPNSAKEVLVHAYAVTGSVNITQGFHYQIYTKEGATRYPFYLYVSTYSQNALSYNSDNFWLPITSDRLIGITLTDSNNSFNDNLAGAVAVIGYR